MLISIGTLSVINYFSLFNSLLEPFLIRIIQLDYFTFHKAALSSHNKQKLACIAGQPNQNHINAVAIIVLTK